MYIHTMSMHNSRCSRPESYGGGESGGADQVLQETAQVWRLRGMRFAVEMLFFLLFFSRAFRDLFIRQRIGLCPALAAFILLFIFLSRFSRSF